ncbi:MAG: hypothetical protein HYX96_05975 [Chloroflexi bacterium]|nr:hypothetical protein [Chloroflexota bacterium]
MAYAELHCHSYYSFHDGAASLEELLLRAKELGATGRWPSPTTITCAGRCASPSSPAPWRLKASPARR